MEIWPCRQTFTLQCGRGAVAGTLSGTGSDGATGSVAVKRNGGTVIAQNEATAEFFGMPGAVIGTGRADLVLPLDEIAGAIERLVREASA